MDVNNISSSSLTDVSTLSSSVNLESVSSISELNSDSKSPLIVSDTTNKRSDLATSLKDYMNQINIGQQRTIQLNNQTEILNNIQSLANTIPDTEDQTSLSEQISAEISNYNSIAVPITTDISELNEDTESTSYFDGILGAKPLSTTEIMKEIEKHTTQIKQQQTYTSNELQKVEKKALDTIGKEMTKSAQQAPFEPVDYSKNISNFSSANINSVVGSVAASQANAIPAHSPKLLA